MMFREKCLSDFRVPKNTFRAKIKRVGNTGAGFSIAGGLVLLTITKGRGNWRKNLSLIGHYPISGLIVGGTYELMLEAGDFHHTPLLFATSAMLSLTPTMMILGQRISNAAMFAFLTSIACFLCQFTQERLVVSNTANRYFDLYDKNTSPNRLKDADRIMYELYIKDFNEKNAVSATSKHKRVHIDDFRDEDGNINYGAYNQAHRLYILQGQGKWSTWILEFLTDLNAAYAYAFHEVSSEIGNSHINEGPREHLPPAAVKRAEIIVEKYRN